MSWFKSMARLTGLARTPMILLLAAAALAGEAGELPAAGKGDERAAAGELSPDIDPKAVMRQLGPGRYELGEARFDLAKKEVSFPAQVNVTDVPLEYALVSAIGKLHESLLMTQADPAHIHMALLFLTGKDPAREDPARPGEIRGRPISAWIEFQDGEKERKVRLESWIFNKREQSVMPDGDWIFNGSRISEGVFVARRDGSIISIIEDVDAVVNNPREGRENDEIWFAADAALDAGAPVTVILKVEEVTKKEWSE